MTSKQVAESPTADPLGKRLTIDDEIKKKLDGHNYHQHLFSTAH